MIFPVQESAATAANNKTASFISSRLNAEIKLSALKIVFNYESLLVCKFG